MSCERNRNLAGVGGVACCPVPVGGTRQDGVRFLPWIPPCWDEKRKRGKGEILYRNRLAYHLHHLDSQTDRQIDIDRQTDDIHIGDEQVTIHPE